MSTTRVGSTKKFAEGWENIFAGGGKKTAKKSFAKGGSKKSAKTKSAKHKAKRAKNVAPGPAAHMPGKTGKHKPAGVGKKHGPGEKAMKSAAKRTSRTGKKRSTPVIQQMELF